MVVIIDGVKVEMPKKLEPRMVEVSELVDMVKQLARKQHKIVNEIHVWETKRHELCFADFTRRPEPVQFEVHNPVQLEIHNPVGVIESEAKMDLILAERGKVLEAIEMSMKVLDTEKQCVERQFNGMCDNKRDCENCDLALDRDTIILGYDRALKCMKHLRDTVIDL